MRAKNLSDILKAGDRVAISNITGREAAKVTQVSQKYCNNIVGGWALGKGGQKVDIPGCPAVPVFSTVEDMVAKLPADKQPNKVVVYSPPTAVYGDVKDVVTGLSKTIETIFIVTEHVSIEVMAKIYQICKQANIDVFGGNSLGVINTNDGMRVGAVGGTDPAESFIKGSATIISNSGNMVNTMASYLQSAGIGNSFGISTGKDTLILTPLKDLLALALEDKNTRFLVTYIEPGGLYEKEAIEMMQSIKYPKPVIAYITGGLLQTGGISLGHAGAVVEGKGTSATDKMEMFDDYFGIAPFDPDKKYEKNAKTKEALRRGIRITTLHHLPAAVAMICDLLGLERDFKPSKPLKLNPWFLDYKGLGKQLSTKLILHKGLIPKPYDQQVKMMIKETLGANPPRRSMRNASHASSNDGKLGRIYGYSLDKQMVAGSFTKSLLLSWIGREVRDFEAELVEKCLIASLSNGPGSISAQGAKLSTSAGNPPNTAMIATLACLGDTHGGNGRRAVEYMAKVFAEIPIDDPWDKNHGIDLQQIIDAEANAFAARRDAAKEAGISYDRIPCLGHPVFNKAAVNFDPREQVVVKYLQEKGLTNIFLDFYHGIVVRLKELGISKNVWAVNVDGAIAAITLAMVWKSLKDKQITMRRACDIAFMIFALGRVAGAGGEFLDHQDYGSPMDMRVPTEEEICLTKAKD